MAQISFVFLVAAARCLEQQIQFGLKILVADGSFRNDAVDDVGVASGEQFVDDGNGFCASIY